MAITREDWSRLLPLVEQAVALPPPDRTAWLQAQSLPDALKAALSDLLDQRRLIETGNFLAELPAIGHLPPLDAPGRLRAGLLVGPWRLLQMIGEGGMSTVWLAERADAQVTRQVALKLPHAGPGQDLLARRLLRERNILAALEHPHIARLYDVGLTDAGTPYLVMEYVPGTTLLAHADAHHLDIPQRLALFQQVLRAVQYAHGKLVLHRDLKPSNILVNDAGEVKLLDFGIAKLLANAGSPLDDTELTRSAGRQLTPYYASPEQLRGQPLGTASDVFSLGVMLYELLCGSRPHAQPTGASLAQLEDAVLNRSPKPPSRHTLSASQLQARGLAPGGRRLRMDGDLDAIVLKALAKAPEQRYGSVEAMSLDLARWMAGEPVSAQAPSAWQHGLKFIQRHQLAVSLSGAALVLLMTASAMAWLQARKATQEASNARATLDFLLATFKHADLNHAASKDLTAKALLDNGRQRAANSRVMAPMLRAQLLQYIGQAQVNMSDRVGADQSFTQAAQVYGELGEPRQQALVWLDQADNALALGRHDDAHAAVERAASRLGHASEDSAAGARLAKMQGVVAMFRGQLDASRSHFERCLALAQEPPGLPAADRVEVLLNLAWLASRSHQAAHAMTLIEQASQTLNNHPEVPVAVRMDVVNYRQSLIYDDGRHAEIVQRSPQEIADCDRALSPESATCLKLKLRLHGSYLKRGQVAEALALNAQLEPLRDPSSPRDQLQATAAMLRALARSGQLGAAQMLVLQLQDLAATQRPQPLDAPYRFLAMSALAEWHVLAHQPLQALQWIAQADALADTLAQDHPLVLPPRQQRPTRLFEGVALHLLGQPDRALAALAQRCAAASDPAGAARATPAVARLNCVAPLVASGQSPAALSLLQALMPALNEHLGADAPTTQRAQRWLDTLQSKGRWPQPLPPADLLFN